MHFHPSRILSGPLRPQSTKPAHPRSFNLVLGTPSQPRTLTTSAKRCLSPAKPEPSRRTTAHTSPGTLELRESLQIYTRKQPRMEYNSFRGNAAPGGGNFAMQPSQMPSFYFDTTPSGTSQFHSGPSFPAPTAPHGGIQTNQPVSIPTGPAAMTRLPPPNAPTEPKGKLNKKAKARGEKGIKRKIKNNNGATEERDKVVAPSAASGGIPNPTPAYLRQAHNPPTTLARPRAILVVLDLNGTLLHRPDRRRSHNFIERPYAKRFMHYCIDTLHVAVWSSARPENVAKMVAQLAEGGGGGDVAPAAYASRLVAAWGRDKFDLTPADYVKRRFMHYCIDTLHVAVWSSARPENVAKMVAQLAEGGGDVAPAAYASRLVAAWGRDKFDLTPADYVKRVQCYKRLQRIWADAAVQASHPDGLRWDQTNTVLVDDSLEKARSEPFNLLRIPEFFGDADEATDVLPQVHDYINALCYQADISQYMRLHPFGLRDDYTLERPPSA
ncbi:hypothetical protein BN1723_011187 [Verticillium longisporum]|uniref:Mitochondrial import inner membrane translocase subunit TIM50 n=1 Tax=Verticillium longisporum TaxID=100787 RepID=A0A0G4L4U5_VERLO|nr:hypothetical protein BN1723_011187 [Verticillium longisporum]